MITRVPSVARSAPASAPTFSRARAGILQRKCACGGAAGTSGECAACRNKAAFPLQRSACPSTSPGVAPAVVHDVLRSPGQPLDKATRAFFEPRLGHDFGKVRVHSDAKAAESARAVNARAYTVGRDIVFEQGGFAPGGDLGRNLLGHELTHVVQQSARDLSGSSPGALRMGAPQDAMEREADRFTVSGAAPEISAHAAGASRTAPGVVMRQQKKDGASNPCAGWESDPQSFSIQLARLYYRTEYPNPKSKDPSVSTVVGAWDPKVAYFVNFDNGDTVGVSMKFVPTGGPAVACTKQGARWCFHRCEYTYTCDGSGAISFTKTVCRDTGASP